MVAQTAKKFGIDFINKGVVLKPAIREVLFLDAADFRLYNNSFILRRRIRYRDGFPAGEPEIVFKLPAPDIQKAESPTYGQTSPVITGSSSRRRPCR